MNGPTLQSEPRLGRARLFMWVSAALLCVSLVAVIACTRAEWSRIVPYLMWNHVAIIAVGAFAVFAVRGLSKNSSGRASPRPRELFAPWVLLVAVLAAAAAIPGWGASLSPWDTGKAPDGSAATSHRWHASSDGASYYESFNRGPDREISKTEFEDLQRGLYSGFARMWVLFSFISLMMWRFVALSRKGGLVTTNLEPTEPVTSLAARSAPGWKSTGAIAAIWTLAIGANLLGLAPGPRDQFCSMPMTPDMRVIILVMPLLLFSVSALLMRRSPFMSPWIASLIDERLGAGSSDAFMVRLKPLLLFSVAGLIGSAVLASECWQRSAGQVDWAMPGFLASGSIAFALAHCILRWRRVPGV